MNNLEPLGDFDSLKKPISWMLSSIHTFEEGLLDKKTVSTLATKTLKKIKKYTPKPEEKENYEAVVDLCVSLSTIDRAEDNFKKFYLSSLKEELNKVLSLLEEENNE